MLARRRHAPRGWHGTALGTGCRRRLESRAYARESAQLQVSQVPAIGRRDRSDAQRRFAIEVVEQLRAAGYEAYWAGGCVRDELLGRTPKDYDVATSATARAKFAHCSASSGPWRSARRSA